MATITETLAEYIVNASYEDFPTKAIEIAKLSIIDSIGCALVGSKTEIGLILLDIAQELGGKPEAPLIGTNIKISCLNAAFFNAELANAIDIDDTYPYSAHVGASVVQTALSVGCKVNASGKELLTAVILGYEITTRIGGLIQHPLYTSTKTSGHCYMGFGAAAVASKLLGLDKDKTTMAMGIAGATAPVPSDEKITLNPFNVEIGAPMVKNNYGVSAENAVRAAFLAQQGYTGPIDIMEGDTGFPVMVGAHNYGIKNLEDIRLDLGKRPQILDLQFKPYPSCRHTHSPIEAVLDIKDNYKLKASDIDEIIVKMFSNRARAPLDDIQPKNATSAQMSIPYAVALALLDIEPGLEWHLEKTRQRKDVLELMKKVKLQPDPEADALEKQGQFTLAFVEISSDGKIYEKRVFHPLGSAENPMTKHELENKFINLTTSALSLDIAKDILNSINKLEQIMCIEEITNKLLLIKNI